MMPRTIVSLTFIATCLAVIATVSPSYAAAQRHVITVKHSPIASSGDVSGSWSARQNVIESKQYEHLLRTNPAFRRARERKECGPITDPQLRQSCLTSFEQYASASPPPRHRARR